MVLNLLVGLMNVSDTEKSMTAITPNNIKLKINRN